VIALSNRGSPGVLSLFLAVLWGCGSAGSGGQGSQMPSAGNGGSVSQAGAASAGTPGSAGAGAAVGGALNAVGGGGSSTAGASAAGAGGGSATNGTPLVYVGSTNGQISLYQLDASLGQLTFVKSIAAGNYPSFLAFDPSRAHLYAVNEPDAMVASFAVNAKTGDLTFLNRVASGGAGPAFVGVDRSGKYLLVANYDGGTTSVFPIGVDGSLGASTDNKAPGMNPHMIITDPANKFAFVMNLGSDTIVQYVFDATNGTLSPNSVPSLMTAAKAGPRHLAFHPNGKLAYVIDELNNTVSTYSYNAALGQLGFVDSLSTLPNGANGAGVTGGEVVVAPSGNFVYGSNRVASGNTSSIARFSVDAASGKLTLIDSTLSGGDVPRSFTLSADGKLMLVANESGNVVSFSVDVASGALHKLLSIDVPQKPQFVGIVSLPVASVR
jgi:6-phosphogluconolactonase